MLAILTVAHPNQAASEVFFSWTPGSFACNFVDEQGQHLLQPLADPAAAVPVILLASGLAQFKPAPEGTPADPEAVARGASLRAVLLTVADAQRLQQEAGAISWLVSFGQVWLLAPRPEGGDASLRPVTPAELAAALTGHLSQAINRTAAALADEMPLPA